jgi:hypothetical protein
MHHLLVGMTAILLAAMLSYAYMIMDGVVYGVPITFDSTTLKTSKSVYRPGEDVQAVMSFCKRRDLEASTQWTLIDTYLKIFPEKKSQVATGCYQDKLVVVETIPLDTYPDTYHFDGYITYKINFFSTVRVHLQTQPFEVK